MRRAGFARRSGRDKTCDHGAWQVLGLVTVRTADGLMFGRLEARVSQGFEPADTAPPNPSGRWRRAANAALNF